MTLYLLATLDTKGREAGFVRDRLQTHGVSVRLVDVGCLGEPQIQADIPRDQVFRAAGTSLATVRAQRDRGAAVQKAAAGARRIVHEAHERSMLSGVLAIGGSAGTTIGTEAMRSLPLGIPKVMVSTLASGQVRQFVGDKDIVMLNSVVDILGVNRISRTILEEAAAAAAGMIRFRSQSPETSDRPLVAATVFDATTTCVEHARLVLEEQGYEVLVFQATGNGGQAMESLIREGMIAGVLDLTTTELADEKVGGFLSAGPTRLTASAETGVPQVVSVGGLDTVHFFGMDTVPLRFRERRLHVHSPNVTRMRTTPGESQELGAELGQKVVAARGPTTIVLPARGVSELDAPGQPFCDPAARQALFRAIQQHCGAVPCMVRDEHINDRSFAEFAAQTLLGLMARSALR